MNAKFVATLLFLIMSSTAHADELSFAAHAGSSLSMTSMTQNKTPGKALSIAYRYEPFEERTSILRNFSFETRYLHWFGGGNFFLGTQGANISVAPVFTVNPGSGVFASVSHGVSIGIGDDARVRAPLRYTSNVRLGIADQTASISAGFTHISSGEKDPTRNQARDYFTVEMGYRFGAHPRQ
jgi:hypothetical protein